MNIKIARGRLWRRGIAPLYAVLLVVNAVLPATAGAALQLDQAIATAYQNDPWLLGNTLQQQAIEAQSTAAGTLPDPVVNIGLANIGTDQFDFNQEPMSQFKVGVSQMFPRGSSLDLRRKQLAQTGSRHPYQRDNRRAKVAVAVTRLWLEVYRAQRTISLIEDDRVLFEHLVDVARANYSTALGRTRQQDLIRSQLELTRLEDRLTRLRQGRDRATERLGEWLTGPMQAENDTANWQNASRGILDLPAVLPEIALVHPELLHPGHPPGAQQLAALLTRHPAILDLDTRIAASRTGVELARQKYKPQWGLNASYGYREDDPVGRDRADLFSVGVTFDLPLFTGNRQDKQVQAATATAEATKTERALLLRSLRAGFEADRAELLRLDERRELYQNRLLREAREQADASLGAYTNDVGDFAEVMRARIDELNTRIEALDIDIDRLQTISQLNYFFAGDM